MPKIKYEKKAWIGFAKPISIIVFWISFFITEQGFCQSGGNSVIELIVSHKGNVQENILVTLNNQSKISDNSGKVSFLVARQDSVKVNTQSLQFKTNSLKFKAGGDTLLFFELEPNVKDIREFTFNDSKSSTINRIFSLSTQGIDDTFIRQNLDNTLANTLERIAGLSAVDMGVGVAKPVIRGLTGNRVLVNDLGIKQEGQQWGLDHGLEIDQFNVERLEIIKGPASFLYGSDAIAGVINILAPLIPKEGFSGEILTLGKTNNSLVGGSVLLAYRKDNFFVRFRTSHQYFGDFRVPADDFVYNTFVFPLTEGFLENTAGNEINYTISGGYIGNKSTLTTTLSFYDQEVGMFPGIMGIPTSRNLVFDGDRRNIRLPKQIISHYKAIVNFTHQWQKVRLESDLGIQRNRRRELANPHGHGYFFIDPNNTNALTLNLETKTLNNRFNFKLFNQHFIAGLNTQYQENNASGFEFLIPNYTMFQQGSFLFTERKVGKGFLNMAVRYDVGQINADSFFDPLYANSNIAFENGFRSPGVNRIYSNISGGLGYSVDLTEHWHTKINLGRSFRLPAPPELTSNGVHHGTFRHELGSPEIESEVAHQIDLNIFYEKGKVSWQGSTFATYFNGFIYLAPAGRFSPLPEAGQIHEFRQHDAISWGGEQTLNIAFSKKVSYFNTVQYVFLDNLETGLPIPFTPPFSTLNGVVINQQISSRLQLELSPEYQLFADQNRVDRNERRTPGFYLLHFRSSLSWSNAQNEPKFILNFRINNMLDRVYFNHISRYRLINLPEQGINFILSANYKF
ncbi:MAG: TonB-dependent receptor plug domain-containing protein [Luteibaculaceae bacterium]